MWLQGSVLSGAANQGKGNAGKVVPDDFHGMFIGFVGKNRQRVPCGLQVFQGCNYAVVGAAVLAHMLRVVVAGFFLDLRHGLFVKVGVCGQGTAHKFAKAVSHKLPVA